MTPTDLREQAAAASADLWKGIPDRDFDSIEATDMAMTRIAILIDQLASALPVWRPISEAPKDGRPIWGWLSDTGIHLLQWFGAAERSAEYGGHPEDYEGGWVEFFNTSEEWAPQWWLTAEALPLPKLEGREKQWAYAIADAAKAFPPLPQPEPVPEEKKKA